MYCANDFRRFVGEMICIKHGQVTLRDINKVIENLANANLEMRVKAMMEAKVEEQPSVEEQSPSL
jgi:hypothetical protein